VGIVEKFRMRFGRAVKPLSIVEIMDGKEIANL
jgi:hypothetical protein